MPSTSFKVVSSNVITATPPPFSVHSVCLKLPSTGVYAGENSANDICQVQVLVTNDNGTSAESHIKRPDEGEVAIDNLGVLVPPANCGCETMQAPTCRSASSRWPASRRRAK